jgi:integrase
MRDYTFAKVAERYLSQRSVCQEYSKTVQRIARDAGRITADRINAYLQKRLTEVSTITVRNERTILLQLVKSAYDAGLLKDPVRGVMRVKARRRPTQAWTVEQLKDAIRQTGRYQGRHLRSGAPVDVFLRCWLLIGYEAGSRFGDIWSFRGTNLDGDILRWTQAKTGDPIVRHLSQACVADCLRMLKLSPDGRILGWVCGRRQAMRRMRQHLDACGIGGTSKWLRRSGATHIEIAAPGMARRHLGHRTPGLAEQAYLDWGQIRANAPQTPQLLEVVDAEVA